MPDFRRFPVDAAARRDAFPVGEADAAVVVWDGRAADVRRVLALVQRRGIPFRRRHDRHTDVANTRYHIRELRRELKAASPGFEGELIAGGGSGYRLALR